MLRRCLWTGGTIAVCAVLAWLWGLSRETAAQPGRTLVERDAALTIVSQPLTNGGQQIVVFEPSRPSICCYHVDGQTGVISLRSVRNISWDLSLDDFNGTKPSPGEIKTLIEK